MKYDRLYNFISPVTGKLPIDKGYILLGDKSGKSFKSPVLIDIRQDIIDLKRKIGNFEELKKLDHNRIWIGDYDNEPVAQLNIGVINLPPLAEAVFPNPISPIIGDFRIPNPTFDYLSPFDWVMSGPFLPQIFATKYDTFGNPIGTDISSSLAMTQVRAAQIMKRFDNANFIVGSSTVIFDWENPKMYLIPEPLKQLYGLGTTYTFTKAQSLGNLQTGLLKNTVNNATGTLSTAIAGKDYVDVAAPLQANMQLALIRPELIQEGQDVAKLLSRVERLPAANMYLTTDKYWKGGENNIPIEVDIPTYAPKDATYVLRTSNIELPNAQSLNLIGSGILKIAPLSNGSISIASGGKVPTLNDYVRPADLIEEITTLETSIQSQLTAITGYASLGLLTEFLINIGWTTGYSEYLWSKYKPLRTLNKYEDTDDYDKQGGNIWFDANHFGAAGNFKPGLRITSWDSSFTTTNDLFPVSIGLFGYKNELGYVPAQEGFVWQSYPENDSSNSHYRFLKNFGLYYVGHNKGQIGWDRKEILLMDYKYYDEKFYFEKKVNFKQNVNFLSKEAIKIPVGNISERPSIAEVGMIRYNIEI
jgi:hypothetical protein